MSSILGRKAIKYPIPRSNSVMKTYQRAINSFAGIKTTTTPVEMDPNVFSDAENVYVDENYLLSTRKRLKYVGTIPLKAKVIDSVEVDGKVYAILQDGTSYIFAKIYPEYSVCYLPTNLHNKAKLFLVGNTIFISVGQLGYSNASFGLVMYNTESGHYDTINTKAYVPRIAYDSDKKRVTGGKLNLFTEKAKLDTSPVFDSTQIASVTPFDLRNTQNTYLKYEYLFDDNRGMATYEEHVKDTTIIDKRIYNNSTTTLRVEISITPNSDGIVNMLIYDIETSNNLTPKFKIELRSTNTDYKRFTVDKYSRHTVHDIYARKVNTNEILVWVVTSNLLEYYKINVYTNNTSAFVRDYSYVDISYTNRYETTGTGSDVNYARNSPKASTHVQRRIIPCNTDTEDSINNYIYSKYESINLAIIDYDYISKFNDRAFGQRLVIYRFGVKHIITDSISRTDIIKIGTNCHKFFAVPKEITQEYDVSVNVLLDIAPIQRISDRYSLINIKPISGNICDKYPEKYERSQYTFIFDENKMKLYTLKLPVMTQDSSLIETTSDNLNYGIISAYTVERSNGDTLYVVAGPIIMDIVTDNYRTAVYSIDISSVMLSQLDSIIGDYADLSNIASTYSLVSDFTKYRTESYPNWAIWGFDVQDSVLSDDIIFCHLGNCIFIKSTAVNALFKVNSDFNTSITYADPYTEKFVDIIRYFTVDNFSVSYKLVDDIGDSFSVGFIIQFTNVVRKDNYTTALSINEYYILHPELHGTFWYDTEVEVDNLSGDIVSDWIIARKKIGLIDGVYSMNNFLIFTFKGGFVYSSAFDSYYVPVENIEELQSSSERIIDVIVISPTAALMFTTSGTYWLLGSGTGEITACKPVVSQFDIPKIRQKCTSKLALTDIPTVLTDNGIVVFVDSSEVTETSKNLVTLSADIISKFNEFYSYTDTPIVYRDKWFNLFAMNDATNTRVLLYDNRSQAWWYWTFPIAIVKFFRHEDNLYCIDINGNQYELVDNISKNTQTGRYEYFDEVPINGEISENKIIWGFKSHPTACGVSSKGKTLVSTLVMYAPEVDSAESISNYENELTIKSYDRPNIRDAVKFSIREQIHSLSIKEIRTFIPKFNYIAYELMCNMRDTRSFDKLSMSGFVLNFKVLPRLG